MHCSSAMPVTWLWACGSGTTTIPRCRAGSAAGACLRIPRQLKTPGPRLVFRRQYRLYYLLCFLEGWRKQIFICFAAFLLVKQYGTERTMMLILWGLVQVIGFVVSAPVGRLIDRVGERKILVFYFAGLALFFLGYATITNKFVLYGLFVIDSAFFVFVMALTTYVDRIAPPSEHTPTLSMGVAMDHVGAVTMPLVGGFVYASQDDSLFINLFMGSTATIEIRENKVRVSQQTRYPWEGAVKMTIEPERPEEFVVKVRIPGWAQGRPVPSNLYRYLKKSNEQVDLRVNGKTVN